MHLNLCVSSALLNGSLITALPVSDQMPVFQPRRGSFRRGHILRRCGLADHDEMSLGDL
jgi:hypothetical protein